MAKKNIFIVGQEFSTYVSRLYDKISESNHAYNFLSEWQKSFSESPVFSDSDVIEKVPLKAYGLGNILKALLLILFSPYIYKDIFFILFFNRLGGARSLFRIHWEPAIMLTGVLTQKDINVVHVHFVDNLNVRYLKYLPSRIKVVCTFWGSDLFMSRSLWEHYYQCKSITKADIITVTTPEMEMVIASKFGQEAVAKIRNTTFMLSPELFQLIDAHKLTDDKEAVLKTFRSKFGIPDNKIIIAIGNNARLENNHLQILTELTALSPEAKQRLFLVIPASYGNSSSEYFTEVILLAGKTGIPHLFIKDFLPDAEIAHLRLITDIYLHLPIDDALSGTAIEFMYAGKIFITGGWLPYSLFRRHGLHYHQINNFSEINNTLENILSDIKNHTERSARNIPIIRNTLHPDKVVSGWIDMYDSLFTPDMIDIEKRGSMPVSGLNN